MYPMQQPAFVPGMTPAAGALAYQLPQGQRQPAYTYQQRPGANQAVAPDRLPPMPEMIQQRAAAPSRSPVIRGGAPEKATPPRPVQTVAQADWKPVKIPTPTQLGIIAADPTPSATPIASLTTSPAPEQFDLATVTSWLDRLGARSCQRERLAEGIRFVCTFAQAGQPDQAITASGNTEEAALKALVQEVLRSRNGRTVSLR
jgi:hypothetical protein